jgi:hypothetical protein
MADVGLTAQVKAAKKRDLRDHCLGRVNSPYVKGNPYNSLVKEPVGVPWVVAQSDDR